MIHGVNRDFEHVLQHWNQPVPGRNVSQGMAALEVMRKERPAEYVKAVLSIMPKELLLSDSSMADLNDEQIDTLLATLRIELMDKNIAAAAIERLEAEHKRRIDEKVAKGEALRVPLWAVCQPEQVAAEIERVKVSRLAELRQAGETREVVWDEPLVIMTGVPRSPDFEKDWEPLPPAKPYDRYASHDEPRTPAVVRPSEEPAEPLMAHRIRVQVAPPTENDPGAVIEGSYTLTEDGLLRVFDTDQNLLGTERLKLGDDPARGSVASAEEAGQRI
jgi:hypothetical protein